MSACLDGSTVHGRNGGGQDSEASDLDLHVIKVEDCSWKAEDKQREKGASVVHSRPP